jgi:hypothetical protein
VIPGGLWLTLGSGPGLLAIGLAGLLVAWAYSAPPFKLMSRGMGELAITAGWLLVVLGTDYVQRGELAALPLVAGLPFALLVAAILYINQFPDRRADEAAGKRTVVVRLGARTASRGYVALVAFAYLWLAGALAAGAVPAGAAIALLPLVFSVRAARALLADAEHPARPPTACSASPCSPPRSSPPPSWTRRSSATRTSRPCSAPNAWSKTCACPTSCCSPRRATPATSPRPTCTPPSRTTRWRSSTSPRARCCRLPPSCWTAMNPGSRSSAT